MHIRGDRASCIIPEIVTGPTSPEKLRALLTQSVFARKLAENAHSPVAIRRGSRVFHSLEGAGRYWHACYALRDVSWAAKAGYLSGVNCSGVGPRTMLATNMTTEEIVSSIADRNTLVVASPSHSQISGHDGRVMVAHRCDQASIIDALDAANQLGSTRVVVVGGGVAQDLGKAISQGRELVVVPSIPSTNCFANNVTVVGSGLQSFSLPTATPYVVALSRPDFMELSEAVRRHWAQSGFGDFFAGISAAMDRLIDSDRPATEEALRAENWPVFEALDWVNDSFHGYEEEAFEYLVGCVHRSGWMDVQDGTNKNRIGGEHRLYKALLEVKPRLRVAGATHGQIVAIGTILSAYLHAERTGQTGLYSQIQTAFAKLALPADWSALGRLQVQKSNLIEALQHLQGERNLLGSLSPDAVSKTLETVFGASYSDSFD